MAYPQASSVPATPAKTSKDQKRELVPGHRDREKGLWNFLVWSLFLSQVLTADGVSASGAHAANDDAGLQNGENGHGAAGNTGALPGSPSLMGLLGAGDGEPGDAAQNAGLASSVAAQTLLSHVPGHDAAKLAAIDANQLVHEANAGPAADATSAAPAETAQSAPDDGAGHAGDVGLPNPGDLIGDLGNGVSDVVGDVVQGTVGTLTDTLGDLGDTVQTIVGDAAGPILSDVGGLVQSLGDTLGNSVQSLVTDTVTPVLSDVSGLIQSLGNTVPSLVTDTVTPVLSDVSGLIQSLGDTLGSTVPSLVTDTVTPVLCDVGGLVQSLGDGLGHLADIGLILDPGQVRGGLGNGLTQTTDLITQLPLAATFGDVGETLQSLVADGTGPLVSEIVGLAQPLVDTLGQLADIGLSLDADGTLGSLSHGISDLLGDTIGSAQAPLAGVLDATGPALTAPVGDILAPVLADAADLVGAVGGVAAQALPQVSALLDGVDGLAQSAGQSILADLGLGGGLDGGQNLGGLLGAPHAGADTGSPITISSILDGVGDAIEPVIATGNPADTTSLIGGPLTGVLDGVLASGGSLALNPPVLGNARIDDLFNTGGYTNYNLTLQTGLPDTTNPLPGAGSVVVDSASLLDHLLGDTDHAAAPIGGHESAHIQIVGLPSAIEDLLTRGHGDLL